MTFDPLKGHGALRRGRVSQTGSCYFLTLCTEGRKSGLTKGAVVAVMESELEAMEADETWRMRCLTVMPDHAHLLVRLGERLSLTRAVQRLKAKTSGALRDAGVEWQRGFFDHRLRPDEEVGAVFRYVYLNPYRAGLVEVDERWPHFRCAEEDWAWFREQLNADLPVPEWLR